MARAIRRTVLPVTALIALLLILSPNLDLLPKLTKMDLWRANESILENDTPDKLTGVYTAKKSRKALIKSREKEFIADGWSFESRKKNKLIYVKGEKILELVIISVKNGVTKYQITIK